MASRSKCLHGLRIITNNYEFEKFIHQQINHENTSLSPYDSRDLNRTLVSRAQSTQEYHQTNDDYTEMIGNI